ncbi:hypothetical protein PTKU15_13110 [Paraburkholderia terrae]|nr:hypothetical protein PTKU15_13110 [Paraburkholderia terrae]
MTPDMNETNLRETLIDTLDGKPHRAAAVTNRAPAIRWRAFFLDTPGEDPASAKNAAENAYHR